MPKLIGTALDSPDTKDWKPTREKGLDDRVAPIRSIEKAVNKEANSRKNPSR